MKKQLIKSNDLLEQAKAQAITAQNVAAMQEDGTFHVANRISKTIEKTYLMLSAAE